MAAVRWYGNPWPFADSPDSLVVVGARVDLASLADIAERLPSLDLAAYRRNRHAVDLGTVTRDVSVECVSSAYMRVLLPSWPVAETFAHASTAGAQVAVVSERLAELQSEASSPVKQSYVRIGRRKFEVIGVAPLYFTGAETESVDVWVPFESALELCTSHGALSGPGAGVSVLGRIRSSYNLTAVTELARSVGHTLERLDVYRARLLSRELRVVRWGFGGACILLLIACVNACGLSLVRAVGRRTDFTVRRQLGASSGQIVLGQILELLPVVVIATGVAAVSALGAARVVLAWSFGDAPLSMPTYLVISVASACLALLLSSVWPAIWTCFVDGQARPYPRSIGRTPLASAGWSLLLAQATASFLLLTGGMTVWFGLTDTRRQAGFEVARVGVVTLNYERFGLVDADTLTATFEELQRSISRITGVETTAVASSGLLGSLQDSTFTGVSRFQRGSETAARARAAGPVAPAVAISGVAAMSLVNGVSPGYFQTVGTRLVNGRTFQPSDDAKSEPVMLVDQNLAETVWPETTAVGQCGYVGGGLRCVRIVGIVEKRRPFVVTQDSFEMFIPLAQSRLHDLRLSPKSLFVRFGDDLNDAAARLGALLREAKSVPPGALQWMDELARTQTRGLHVASRYFELFAAGAIAMTMSSVYVFAAFSMTWRRREIGLRHALGATRARLVWTLCRGTCYMTLGAVILGGACALLAGRAISALATGVQPPSVAVLVAAGALLSLAMLAGAGLPLFRAVAAPPANCLRE
jgi:putative ABC transport system permease protein